MLDGSHIGRRFGPQDKNGPSWMQWPGCSAVDPLFWKLPALVTQLNFLKFIHPADWLRLAATRTRPHEWRRAARRFEGHDIGYFYPGLGANGILHQITRPSLRNLNQTFFRTTGIRREMNKTRYIYHVGDLPLVSHHCWLFFFPAIWWRLYSLLSTVNIVTVSSVQDCSQECG